MRDRKEIFYEALGKSTGYNEKCQQSLRLIQIELLLDIRELLEMRKNGL